jgi:adhesin transport system membrane fusion protein
MKSFFKKCPPFIEVDDLRFLSSKKEAILLQVSRKSVILVWISLIAFIAILCWMYFTKIDQLTRGEGRVVPSKKVQVVQNLEGGIVTKIYVSSGDVVSKGDILVKIDDTMFSSKYQENRLKIYELEAKIVRLKAESEFIEFPNIDKNIDKNKKKFLEDEKELFLTNKRLFDSKLAILNSKLNQKNSELEEKKLHKTHLTVKAHIIKKQFEISKGMLEHKVTSKMEHLKLQERLNDVEEEMYMINLLIPKYESIVSEAKSEVDKLKTTYVQNSRKELVDVRAKLKQENQSKKAKEDRVNRTLVKSPVNGVVKQLFINTVGGVVKPGSDIVEVVPMEDKLVVDTKIRPADIAFIHPNQKATVRFSSYDFAIYGALEGKVINISADTIVDEIDRKNYYLIQIRTDKNFLGNSETPLPIMPGMIATVDIIIGKKSIMDFILKPIMRAKQNFLSQR